MKKSFIASLFVFFAVLFLCGGCSLLFPATENIRYYDLNYGKETRFELPCRFAVRSFNNLSPARMNMLYNLENSVVELDQYNLWVQSPEVMLNRFIFNAVVPASDLSKPVFNAALTIFEFKFDVPGKKAVLGIKAVLYNAENDKCFEKNYVLETKVDSVERSAFVNAMNQCAEKFVIQAVNDIKKI